MPHSIVRIMNVSMREMQINYHTTESNERSNLFPNEKLVHVAPPPPPSLHAPVVFTDAHSYHWRQLYNSDIIMMPVHCKRAQFECSVSMCMCVSVCVCACVDFQV